MSRIKPLYQKNLLWLKKYFHTTFLKIQNQVVDENKYKFSTSKSGIPNLEVLVHKDWTPLYSIYDPEQEVNRWASQQQLKDIEEFVLYGIGLGYHLMAIFNYFPKMKVHLYEPDIDLFIKALEVMDLSHFPQDRILNLEVDDHKQDNLFSLKVTHTQARFFKQVIMNIIDRSPIVQITPSYQKLYPDNIQVFMDFIKSEVQKIVGNLNATLNFEKLWTLNALRNLDYTLNSLPVEVLKPLISGKPLVIVSSGPSMEKEIENLKKIKDHVVMIASGSAINGLLHHGIVPSAVVSYDPQIGNKYDFDLFAKYQVEIPFVFGTTIYHEILEQNQFSNFFHAIISPDKITSYLMHKANIIEYIYSDAPSIAVINLQIAYLLGANPIIFVGQDLAFPDKKFYSAGVSETRDQSLTEEESADTYYVEKIGGGQVLTNKSMDRMRFAMEQMLSIYSNRNPEQKFINTSQDGAKIAYMTEMELADCIDRYIDLNVKIENPFEYGKNKNTDELQGGLTVKQLKEIYNKIWLEHPRMNDYMQKLGEIAEKLSKATNSQQVGYYLVQLDNHFQKMIQINLFRAIYQPMMSTQLELYGRTARTIHEPTIENAKKVVDQCRQLIAAYHSCLVILNQFNLIESTHI